jgi:predicted transcriptional regulator
MLTARELMTPPGVFVDPDDHVNWALERMHRDGISGVPVVNSCQQLLGFLSESSIRQQMPATSADLGKVYHYMDREVCTVDTRASAFDLGRLFERHAVHQIWVTDQGQLVGTIARRDAVRCINALRLSTHRAHVDRTPAFGATSRSVRTNDGPVGNRLGIGRRVFR